MDLLDNIIDNFGLILLFINTLLFLFYIKSYKNNRSYLLFTAYLVIISVIQAWSFYYAYDGGRDNLFLSHYYFILQFVILSLFYKNLFLKQQKKYVSVTLVIILTILMVRYINEPSLYFKFDLVEIFICSLPIVIYSIIYLYNSLNMSKGYLYINAGILLYLSTSTLIFILGNYLSTQDVSQEILGIWMINSFMYLIYLILISVEWFQNYRPIKTK